MLNSHPQPLVCCCCCTSEADKTIKINVCEWHTQHASLKATFLKMMFRFGLLNSNNMTAGGATSLCCSLFLAVSFNNNQGIVCGGLEKHLPWPWAGDPVYLMEAAVSNLCLSGILGCHLLDLGHPPKPTPTLQKSGSCILHSLCLGNCRGMRVKAAGLSLC